MLNFCHAEFLAFAFFQLRFGNGDLCRLVSTLCSVLAVLSSALLPKTLCSASSAQRSSLGKRRWCLPRSCAISGCLLRCQLLVRKGAQQRLERQLFVIRESLMKASRLVIPTHTLESSRFPCPGLLCCCTWHYNRLRCRAATLQQEASPATSFLGTKGFPLAPLSAVPCLVGPFFHLGALGCGRCPALVFLSRSWGGIIFLFPSNVFHWRRAGPHFFLSEPFLWHCLFLDSVNIFCVCR